MMNIDIWAPIIINDERLPYNICSNGNVYSIRKDIIMKSAINKHGYWHISLTDNNGTSKNYSIHRLVAIAFVPIDSKYTECGLSYNDLTVNHKDGNKSNNTANNLEWCTGIENTIHGHKNGLFNKVYGENCHMAKLDKKTVQKCCKLLAKGKSNKYIAKKLGISSKMVTEIRHRNSWKHESEGYEFPIISNNIISDKKVHKICKLLELGERPCDIAKKLKITQSYIYNIKYRRIRKDISDQYIF